MIIKLPFIIDDGVSVRECDFTDLKIIIEMHLKFQVYSQKKTLWIFNTKKLESEGLIYILYASLKSLDYVYSPFCVRISERIKVVECPELHRWKNNIMLLMVLGII